MKRGIIIVKSCLILCVLFFYGIVVQANTIGEKKTYNLEVITNHGRFFYELDNSGDNDVASDLQKIFNEMSALKDVSASFIFCSGHLLSGRSG